MSDPFVPEADAAEQRREVSESDEAEWQYPAEAPLEASEADVLEQSEPVPEDDEDQR